MVAKDSMLWELNADTLKGSWSTSFLLPALILIAVLLVFKYPDRVIGSESLKGREMLYVPPGSIPLLGHTLKVEKLFAADPMGRLLELAKASPISSYSLSFVGMGRVIVLNDPAYVQYITSTHFANFPKGSQLRDVLSILLGEDGIFVADGETWKHARKKGSLMFSSRQFREHVSVVIHHELEQAVALLDTVSSEAGEGKLDFTQLLFRFTLSGFAKMAFSADLKCFSKDPASLESPMPFGAALDRAQNRIEERPIFWYLSEFFSKAGRELREDVKTIHEVGKGIITKRLEEYAACKASEKGGRGGEAPSSKHVLKQEGEDLLDFFMQTTDSPDELLTVVINFIIAGRDTTAQGLSWLMYELCASPEWFDRIRAELAEAGLGIATDGSYRLEYEDVSKLPLTLAVWSEALRLHPPVPRQTKFTMEDDLIVPQGPNPRNLPPIPVKAGETVAWCDWAMARLPEIWGEDCENFNPERFLVKDEATGKLSFIQHGQYKFHVFNSGPRLCLGMNLANFEALAFIAAVMRYDFKWATEEQGQTSPWPPTYGISLTHPVKHPYVLTVERRV